MTSDEFTQAAAHWSGPGLKTEAEEKAWKLVNSLRVITAITVFLTKVSFFFFSMSLFSLN